MTTQNIVKFLPQLRCKPSPYIIVVNQGNTNKISTIKYEYDYEFTKFVVLFMCWRKNDDPDASNKEITELLPSLY